MYTQTVYLFKNTILPMPYIYISFTNTNKNKTEKLQKDLDTLGEWAVENGMKINPGNCKVISFIRKLGLKIHWVTPFVTKKFWKRAVVNTCE